MNIAKQLQDHERKEVLASCLRTGEIMWVLGRARGHCMWSLGTSAIMKKKVSSITPIVMYS